MAEMKTLNGYEIVDQTARDRLNKVINPNILVNTLSDDFECIKNWVITRINTVDKYTISNGVCTFISTTNTSNPDNSNGIGIQISRNNSGLKTGDTVTFSANIKGTIGSGNPYIQYWASTETSSNTWGRRELGDSLRNISSTEYKRYKVTVTLRDLYKDYTDEVFAIGGGYGSTISFKDIKLEYGTEDTSSPFEFLRPQIIVSTSTPLSSYGRDGDIYYLI